MASRRDVGSAKQSRQLLGGFVCKLLAILAKKEEKRQHFLFFEL